MVGALMESQGTSCNRAAWTFLVLSVLLFSSFADREGDREPRSTIRDSVPHFDEPGPALNAVPKTSRHESGKPSSGAAQQDVRRRSKDLAAGSPKLIGFEPPLWDLAQPDPAEVEHTWSGGDDQPSWTGGAIGSLPSSFDGARFNLTRSLSGAVELILPFGGAVADEVSEGEFDDEFRVFGSLTTKF